MHRRIKVFMDRNTQGLLLSELHSAHAYLERLLHGLIELSSLHGLTQCRLIAAEADFRLSELIETKLLRPELTRSTPHELGTRLLRKNINQATVLTRSLIELQGAIPSVVEFTVEMINFFYDVAYDLHVLVSEQTELEIQYPRLNLLEMNTEASESKIIDLQTRRKNNETDTQVTEEMAETKEETRSTPRRFGKAGLYSIKGGLETFHIEPTHNEPAADHTDDELGIAHFRLPLEAVKEFSKHSLSSVESLEWQREKKYEELLHLGHEAIYQKDNNKALELFNKARNYRETAEILTLIGWTHSLLAQNEKAKSYCLKAIKIDPDYGPPYNDLGSYLLSEGLVDESLKWFDLAKKAPHYQNREYPYINSGRAFMAKRDLAQALEEFSKALTLAPYHEDLHKTVEKLKKSITKGAVDEEENNPTEPGPLS